MQIEYRNLVTTSRTAARDILRTKKVSALLSFISNQTRRITESEDKIVEATKRFEEYVLESNKDIARMEYAIRMAEETQNPDAESIKERLSKEIAQVKESIAATEKRHENDLETRNLNLENTTKEVAEKVAEYEAKIAAWQTGESKVNRETMIELAEKLAEKRVTEAFVTGEYDDEATL